MESWWRPSIAGVILEKWSFGHATLTSHVARRLAKAIARIPEFMMQRKGFYARGPGIRRFPSTSKGRLPAWPPGP